MILVVSVRKGEKNQKRISSRSSPYTQHLVLKSLSCLLSP
jgi:hypothetical protein